MHDEDCDTKRVQSSQQTGITEQRELYRAAAEPFDAVCSRGQHQHAFRARRPHAHDVRRKRFAFAPFDIWNHMADDGRTPVHCRGEKACACLHVRRCSCRFGHAHLPHEKSCGGVACSSFIVSSREHERCRPAVYWLSGVRGHMAARRLSSSAAGCPSPATLIVVRGSACAPHIACRCRPEASRPTTRPCRGVGTMGSSPKRGQRRHVRKIDVKPCRPQ